MAIEPGYQTNFNTLEQAFDNGDVCLLECQDIKSGEKRVVICAAQREEDGGATFVPLAKMFDGNPYEEVRPPG